MKLRFQRKVDSTVNIFYFDFIYQNIREMKISAQGRQATYKRQRKDFEFSFFMYNKAHMTKPWFLKLSHYN